MEKKIGEIFERNGEWYQCVEHKGCHSCAFTLSHGIRCGFNGDPHCAYRSDGKPVIFKKLKKVGEPFSDENFGLVQKYELEMYCYRTKDKRVCFADGYDVFIKIKQTKEDMEDLDKIKVRDYTKVEELNVMEEKKLNLKPFDIQKAREGKPVCTRDGRKARIICFDRKDNTPIVALIERVDGIEILQCFYNDRKCFHDSTSDNDLMMLPEKKEGWVNVYKGIDGVTFSKHPYTSKDEAIKKSGILFGRIDTIKVSWEE